MAKGGVRYLLATSLVALAAAAQASETVTYTYDALGRLTATSSSGTVNNGVATSVGYDPAGNRSAYTVTGAGGGTPPPPPPPPPPPSNNPPTPVNDSGAQGRCTTATYNVVQNDTDPDGDYPLEVTQVSGAGFSVFSTTTLQFTSGSPTGAKVGTYTVRDSRGATANATLTVNVSGGSCL